MPSPEHNSAPSSEVESKATAQRLQPMLDDFNADPHQFDRLTAERRATNEARGNLSRTAFSAIAPSTRLDSIPEAHRVGPSQGSMTEDLYRTLRLQ
jgi:hypothetical protein